MPALAPADKPPPWDFGDAAGVDVDEDEDESEEKSVGIAGALDTDLRGDMLEADVIAVELEGGAAGACHVETSLPSLSINCHTTLLPCADG